MCTLIALVRPHARVPLVVAANRDEYLDRPAAGPAILDVGERRILAPRDPPAGGPWLGLNESRLFAALTNRPNPAPDKSLRSRGLLVLDALAETTAQRAAERLAGLPAGAYNPFNLFVADAERAFVAVYEGAPRVTELAPGPHVIGNADPDDRRVPKVARLLDAAEAVAAGPREWWLQGLAAICRGHEPDAPLASACVHAGAYGTRCSTLLALGEDADESELHFSDGPPCAADLRDRTDLLRALPSRTADPARGARVGSLR